MEPFSIVCRSCAAKLKVTKLSAVGQVLACPKCGSMVRVKPPQGWVAPKPKRRDSESLSNSNISANDSDPSAYDPLADIPQGEVSQDQIPLGGNFEDLDDILSQTPPSPSSTKPSPQKAKRKKTSTSRQSKTDQAQSERQSSQSKHRTPRPVQSTPPITSEISRPKVRQRQTNPIPGDEAPVLPNEDWTSDSTRKRKRLVTTIVAVAGSLMLLVGIAAAVVMNLPVTGPAPVANTEPEKAEDPQEDPFPEPKINPNFIIKNEEEKGLLDEQDLAANQPPIERKNPFESAPPPVGRQPMAGQAPPVGDEPAIAGNGRPNNRIIPNAPVVREPARNHSKLQEVSAPDIDDGVIQGADQGNKNVPVAPPKLLPQSPFAKAQDDGNPDRPPNNTPFDVTPKTNRKPTEVGLVETFDSDLGELSTLLRDSGTSITDLRELTASIQTQPIAGLPKYLVTRPEPNKLDSAKQMEIPIGGLKYVAAPLSQIVKDLSAIGGIPISIDADSIVATGKDPNPQVTTILQDTTLNGAITSLVLPLNLSIQIEAEGAVVGSFPDPVPTPFEFEIPAGVTGDEAKNNLLETVKVLVEPGSWDQQNASTVIEIAGDKITGTSPPAAQQQIKQLLQKLSASFVLSENPGDLNALTQTTTRWKSAEPNLASDPGLQHTVQREVNDFLHQVLNNSGVTVLVNWKKVSEAGWSPQTIIPGNVQEKSVEETISSIAQAMNLTFRAVNSKTIVLTTFADAAETVDLEVYPIMDLVPSKLSPEMLRDLVMEAMGAQLQSHQLRYTYQPDCHCLLVAAPQQLQRQIEGLIDRLKVELKAGRNPQPNQQAMSPPTIK